MSVRDILVGETPQTAEGVKSTNVPAQPDINFFEQLGVALDKPSITGGALYRVTADMIEGSKSYSKEELQGMYPDAPEGTFTTSNTKRMADWIYKRSVNEDLFSNVDKLRSLNHGEVYNKLSHLGYGLAQETSPTDIALGVATAGTTSFLTEQAAMLGSLGSVLGEGVASNSLIRGVSYLGGSSAKAVIASELAQGAMMLPVDYGIRKSLEPYTQEKVSFVESALGTIGGAVAGGLLHVGGKKILGVLKPSKIAQRLDDAAKVNFNNGLEEELKNLTEPGVQWNNVEFHNEINKFDGVSLDDRLRYKVYSASEQLPKSMSDIEEGGLYALFNRESEMSHYGAADPFGPASTHASNNPQDIMAYSASIKQGGHIVKLNPKDFKILNLDTLNPKSEEAKVIMQILKDFGVEAKSIQEGIAAIRKMDEAGKLIENEIQDALKLAGYEGVAFSETHDILDKTFKKTNTFLFDGIKDKPRTIVAQVDGSLGGLPESTLMFSPTKRALLQSEEGMLTNGKKIKLDPNGYFDTDPFYGHPDKILAYTEHFSADQIADINRRIEISKPSELRKRYQGLTDDIIDHVKQLKIMSEFEAAEIAALRESQLHLNDLLPSDAQLDIETEKQLVEKLMIDRGNYEANKELIQKSVEQMAKEGKASRVLEEANIDEITQKFIKRIEDRIGTPRENQVEHIIRQYEDIVKRLERANPDVAEEIIKAADHCLRKFTT